MTILIIVGIIVLLGIIFASMYNSLVRLRNNRENAFADIDVQLKQRHDLIPQLVDRERICRTRKRYPRTGDSGT